MQMQTYVEEYMSIPVGSAEGKKKKVLTMQESIFNLMKQIFH